MSSKAMSLKGKIKNYAKTNNITAQVVLQNFMFERFLERLSKSEYNNKFIVKGGMLVAAIVGLDTRSTMDLDATVRNYAMTQESIRQAFENICKINLNDDVMLTVKSIEPIRKRDVYGGYCIRIDAVYDTIITPLSIDVSAGDAITPLPVKYEFNGIFDETLKIDLWGYNIETIMAEKIETILSRGIFTTRPRDFYDVYILETTQNYDKNLLKTAIQATSKHRGSSDKICNTNEIITQIEQSKELADMWGKYQKQFYYAKDISYMDIIRILRKLTFE